MSRALSVLERAVGRYLDGKQSYVLGQARADIKRSYAEYQTGVAQNPRIDHPWGFEISSEQSLGFKSRRVDGHELVFDLYGHQHWRDPNDPAIDLLVVCRIWALDDADLYRTRWDSSDLRDELLRRGRRVVSRFHIDKAQAGQEGPEFHVQFGGQARADELCWLLDDVSVPRLSMYPMDFPLACEMIVATLFGVDDSTLRDPLMTGVIRDSQKAMIEPYIRSVSSALDGDERVLQRLWARS